MLVALASHVLCAWFALLLPAYNTYKALADSRRDELPLVATYWLVLACFLAFEHTLGLLLAWLPFYWELRTIFLLYISLPQTQGFTHVYMTLFEPWLSSNEAAFDDALASAQTNAVAFCRSRIAAFLDLVWTLLNSTPGHPQKPVDPLNTLLTADAPLVLGPFAAKDPSGAHVISNSHSGN